MQKLIKTDLEWMAHLTRLQYEVTRQADTERPFTGQYWDNTEAGVYHCVCCETPLFASESKFDAGCGWPSYFSTINDTVVLEYNDNSLGMLRTEIVCAMCDAHLGHVFKDGPPPTGLRYCVNSASLHFQPLKR